MTDPFFKNDTHIHTQLIQQQQEIEENFGKLKALFSDPGLSEEQRGQIKQKLLELKTIYRDNKKKLQEIGVSAPQPENNTGGDPVEQHVHINKIDAVEDKKRGGKFNITTVLLGCGVIFLILLGGVAFLFYYMITHPAELKNIGLSPENVKRLLQTFTTVFFGIVIIVGFILLIMNIYRIFTSKKKSKLSYIGGSLLGIFFLGGGLLLGYSIMERVNTISIDSILNNSNLVRPYIITKDKQEYIGDKNIPIVGPIQLGFGLNTTLLTKQILPKINGKIHTIKLLCGNGQELSKNINTNNFNGICFYRKAMNTGYPLSVNISYIDANTSEQLYKNIDVGNFSLNGVITIIDKDGKILNDSGEAEILGGIAGDTLTFDASDVFKKLGINTYEITWDLNGDGIIDRENETKISYRYTVAGVYTISVRIPSIGDQLYTFPIRIEQSDIPVGDLEYRDLGNNRYTFSLKFFENNKTITKYLFQVLDSEKKVLHRNEKISNNFSYSFNTPGTYYVKSIFLTQDSKQGELLSDPIVIQDKTADFNIVGAIKSYTDTTFKNIDLSSTDETVYNVKVSEIPSTLQLQIERASLESRGYIVSAKENGSPVIFAGDTITIDITSPKTRTISIVATDPESNRKIQKDIQIQVEREGIVGKIIISPDTVGTSPFTVKFDASTSQINDPEDEIIYFTWDFGDGVQKKNISEGVIEHIYYYDIKENNGEYYPTLQIKTRKGKEYTIGEGTRILVKQPIENLGIRIDSHPGQVAEIGDIVKFSLELDGYPTRIQRDFGDGKPGYECKGRECVENNKIYHTAGEYKIRVKVEYENRIPLEGDITLLVK